MRRLHILIILFLITLLYHAYLGLRVIIEDYIHTPWRKYISLITLGFLALGLGALCLLSIIRIVMGGMCLV